MCVLERQLNHHTIAGGVNRTARTLYIVPLVLTQLQASPMQMRLCERMQFCNMRKLINRFSLPQLQEVQIKQ